MFLSGPPHMRVGLVYTGSVDEHLYRVGV